jgi:ferredoxin
MLRIDYHTCLSCVGCISLCPEAALFYDLDSLNVRDDDCTLCNICVKFCPVGALDISMDVSSAGEKNR